jgi:hypothetical protein
LATVRRAGSEQISLGVAGLAGAQAGLFGGYADGGVCENVGDGSADVQPLGDLAGAPP